MSGVIINPYSFASAEAFSSTKSLEFDGVDDYVKTGLFSALDGGTTATFSVWVKPVSGSPFLEYVFSNPRSAVGAESQFALVLYEGSRISFNVSTRTNQRVYGDIAAITYGSWNNIIVTVDLSLAAADRAKIYVNGVDETTSIAMGTITNFNTATDGLYIGEEANGSYNPFNGNIDEFSIFDEVKAIGDIWDGTGQPTDLTSESGLVAWYRMGENSNFLSPQILMPENTNKDKVSNFSMDFDGVDDNIDCGDFSAYDNGDLSCSFWIYRTTSTSLDYLISNTASSSKAGFDIIIDSTERLKFRRNTRTKDCASGWYHGGITVDNWYHIAVTYDEGLNEGKIYVNAVLKATTAGSSSTNSASTDLKIGSHTADTAFFTGNIDEVAIFDSVLSAGDVTAMYNLGQPTDLTGESGLVAWYRMGEEAIFDPAASEWTVPDQVGSNDGTSANMTIEDREGDAPDSENNALSYNMDAADIDPDTP